MGPWSTVMHRQKCYFLARQIQSQLRFRTVTTWSSLGRAFNTLPGKKLNLRLMQKGPGLFQIETLSSPEGFHQMKDQACANAVKLVEEATSPARSRKMVDVFDELSNVLCSVADLTEFIRVAHPKEEYREAAEATTYHISTVVEELNTNKELFNSLKNVVDNGDKFPTTDVDQHVAKLFLFDFEQSGIHLPDNLRKKVVHLTETAMALGQHFINGASKPRTIYKDSIPVNLRTYFSTNGDKAYVSSLQSDCAQEKVREAAYKIYLHPEQQQEAVLQELLKIRRELANTCGFPSFAHRATKGTTAETPEFVQEFLNTLNDGIKPLAREDVSYLVKSKAEETGSVTELRPWDLGYLTGKVKQNFLQTGTVDVSDFFSLGACMEGLNYLTQCLFGITLRYVDVNSNEIWAPDVYKLAVEHESEGLLGHIYCDFYRRSGKPEQDCHFTIRGGRLDDKSGTYQNPIVVLMLNLNPPRWSGPCLLSPGQLDNLAHEMGHALHSMMARTKHQHVTGTRCATDFAEVPSILMEYFMADPRVLKQFAKHFSTKETLPDECIDRLCQSKHLLSAIETQTQILYSVLDQKLHGEEPLQSTTTHLFNNLHENYFFLKPVDNTGWQLRFTHLVGYGARYYSYLLSRSVASCIWQKYFSRDPFSREAGEKYRRDCLSHGGGKPPRLLLAHFLGEQVCPKLMATSLIRDIAQRQETLQKVLD